MGYIPNAYFLYYRDKGTYFWHLKLYMVPNGGHRTIATGGKRRKSLPKLIKDIEKFKQCLNGIWQFCFG